MSKKIKVEAIRKGYYNGAIRREGESFHVHEHELGTWMAVDGVPFARKDIEVEVDIEDAAVDAQAEKDLAEALAKSDKEDSVASALV